MYYISTLKISSSLSKAVTSSLGFHPSTHSFSLGPDSGGFFMFESASCGIVSQHVFKKAILRARWQLGTLVDR